MLKIPLAPEPWLMPALHRVYLAGRSTAPSSRQGMPWRRNSSSKGRNTGQCDFNRDCASLCRRSCDAATTPHCIMHVCYCAPVLDYVLPEINTRPYGFNHY
ncbi:jg27342 [Pararge aegeria aegeria]|uniref:Jg27342 protein n=1 Tax=Pararge aegeria aegeria TaxID=348720 RepID=A0A8S4QIS9_9NEOP|nr:jg27342 [Pararge aegeria aegeria]